MSRLIALFVLLIGLLPGPLMAGAWLRDEGAGFVSLTTTLEEPQNWGAPDGYGALYAEYGLTPDLTLGLDLGVDEGGREKAIVFAVLPFFRDGLRINFEIGVGTGDAHPLLRPGVSVGRDISLAELGGWFSVDARASVTEDHDPVFATDITLGLAPRPRLKLIAQLQQGGPMPDPDWLRAVTSVVWEESRGRHLELGVTAGITGAESFGLKLGLWQEF